MLFGGAARTVMRHAVSCIRASRLAIRNALRCRSKYSVRAMCMPLSLLLVCIGPSEQGFFIPHLPDELEADRQSSRKSGWYRDRRSADKVERAEEHIDEEILHRVPHEIAEHGRQHGSRRPEQHVA